jgi:hypothetical protein
VPRPDSAVTGSLEKLTAQTRAIAVSLLDVTQDQPPPSGSLATSGIRRRPARTWTGPQPAKITWNTRLPACRATVSPAARRSSCPTSPLT